MASECDLGAVLIIGGNGYLGSYIVKQLLSQQTCTSVHIMSRSSPKNPEANAKYHTGDIANETQVSAILSEINPRVIIHTASPLYTTSLKVLWHTNVIGTRTLLKCAASSPSVYAFVYTSTESILLPVRPQHTITEASAEIYTEHSSCNAYAKTKAIADIEVRAANTEKLRTTTLRVPPIYGEGDDKTMFTLLGMAAKGQHKMQIGNDSNNFELVFVEKAAEAHILAAKALLEPLTRPQGRVDGEAFFISDGLPTPYWSFARRVWEYAGYPVKKEEVMVVPYGLVWTLVWVQEWIFWAFTMGRKSPDIPSAGIEVIGRGFEWDISKAKERLGYVVVANQDEVLKRVTEAEMKRLGVKAGPGKA
ncbi:C-3 sterol dehydrogenase/C-4 decarboxylase [Halenospora varia]|nr:C-3 sterol dehydrogenase/C-4 decarboxylase [Halenospora varia]